MPNLVKVIVITLTTIWKSSSKSAKKLEITDETKLYDFVEHRGTSSIKNLVSAFLGSPEGHMDIQLRKISTLWIA
jgi:hypothetical protein